MPVRIGEQIAGERDDLLGLFPQLSDVTAIGEPFLREVQGGAAESMQQTPGIAQTTGSGNGPLNGRPGVRAETGPRGGLVGGAEQVRFPRFAGASDLPGNLKATVMR
ncbi:hypothetical protein [Micromonospora sp. NBRC 110037]|uniref:hypothetical protein n=1 Tax=Micromonospora sp. NBRC 110037 TaxID=1621261 RepID=UPI0007DB0707|nr:hypothetical protein [Micromonospora sp. NBRC 110037]